MLVVQMLGLGCGDEELRSVGVGAGVGHGEQPGGVMLHQKILVIELRTVDALSASAIKILKISTLKQWFIFSKSMKISTAVTWIMNWGMMRWKMVVNGDIKENPK